MVYVVGLTGGIGSGKTLVSDHFDSLGVQIIDTDLIARQIVEPGSSTLVELCKIFGQEILLQTGELDRDALRTIAFATAENKAKLDSITHPAIRLIAEQQIAKVTTAYCIVVVPLLSKESPFTKLMDRIAVVATDEDIKIRRVMSRSKISEAEVKNIMARQISDQERIQFADDLISNNDSINQTYDAVEKLHQKYLKLALAKN